MVDYTAGWVVYHEGADAVEAVRRAAKVSHVPLSSSSFLRLAVEWYDQVGISNGNNHSDKGIVYVNRYDWGWHHGREKV